MRRKTAIVTLTACSLTLGLLAPGARAEQDAGDSAETWGRASTIFVGAVKEKASVSFPGVPVSPRTVVVEVTQVIHKPHLIPLSAGQRVTVELLIPESPAIDEPAVFFTEGWILGDGVALRELGHQPLAAEASTDQLSAGIQEARQQHEDQKLKGRIERAVAIVRGKVASVSAAPRAATRVLTEHAAEWQQAIVDVDSWIKGSSDAPQIVVRFPGSDDVAHFAGPRPRLGGEHVFLLEPDGSGLPPATSGGKEVPTYQATKPAHLLLAADEGRVKSLLQ